MTGCNYALYKAITKEIYAFLETGEKLAALEWQGMGKAGRPRREFEMAETYRPKAAPGFGPGYLLATGSALSVPISDSPDYRYASRIELSAPPRSAIAKPECPWQPVDHVEEVIQATGARILEGGSNSSYRYSDDTVVVPDRYRFASSQNFYACLLHELSHWTGHESRLARNMQSQFGTLLYVMEEITAELGAAFLCGELGLEVEAEHRANYIATWTPMLSAPTESIAIASWWATKVTTFVLHPELESQEI